jgi:TonB family protein
MLPAPLRRLTLLAALSLVFCPIIRSLQTDNTGPGVYLNNPDGLRQLLDQMLIAAKHQDHARLQSLIRDAEIPNYEEWFTKTFGQEKSESWAEPYGKMIQKDQEDFQDLLIRLSRMEGAFSIQKVDTTRRYDTLRGPLDEYIADWKKAEAPAGEKPEHIAEFFFIEGKFRWDSTSHFFPLQNTKTGPPVTIGKLIKRVPPKYHEEAREKSIQGTVILNVILRRDGSVLVQDVAEGDPILAPAAIEAVKQWRYEPSLINGEPIELQTKIKVVFALNQ